MAFGIKIRILEWIAVDDFEERCLRVEFVSAFLACDVRNGSSGPFFDILPPILLGFGEF